MKLAILSALAGAGAGAAAWRGLLIVAVCMAATAILGASLAWMVRQ